MDSGEFQAAYNFLTVKELLTVVEHGLLTIAEKCNRMTIKAACEESDHLQQMVIFAADRKKKVRSEENSCRLKRMRMNFKQEEDEEDEDEQDYTFMEVVGETVHRERLSKFIDNTGLHQWWRSTVFSVLMVLTFFRQCCNSTVCLLCMCQ